LRAVHVAGAMVVIVATASGTIVEVATSGAAAHHVRERVIQIFAIALLTALLSFDSHLEGTLLIDSLTMFSLFIDSSVLT